MNKKIHLIVTLCIVFMLTIFFPGSAYACICAELPFPDENLKQSSVTLYGRVSSIEDVEDPSYPFAIRKVDFKPHYILKGEKNHLVSLYTFEGSPLCGGFNFKKGKSYLVYAFEDNDKLRTSNMCSRNKGGPLAFVEFLYLQKYSLFITFISILSIWFYKGWMRQRNKYNHCEAGV
jgi:hypothetical protein